MEIDPKQLSGESAANIVCAKLNELGEEEVQQHLGHRWAIGPANVPAGTVVADIDEVLDDEMLDNEEAIDFLIEVRDGLW